MSLVRAIVCCGSVCTALNIYFQELYVNGARIIRSDIKADNGYVHIIDSFLGVPEEPGDGVPLGDSALGYITQTGTQSTNLKRKTKYEYMKLNESFYCMVILPPVY